MLSLLQQAFRISLAKMFPELTAPIEKKPSSSPKIERAISLNVSNLPVSVRAHAISIRRKLPGLGGDKMVENIPK